MAMFYILDIFKEYSDSNHILTQTDIITKLQNIYRIDIERKTISNTIELLIDYGYDIIKCEPYGYYLNEREFNENEIKYTKNIDLFQNAAGVIIRESCDQQNVINFMLDLAMVIFKKVM